MMLKVGITKAIFFVSLGNYTEAIVCFDEAIKIDENNADAWYNKGLALDDADNDDEAIVCYSKAIEINRDYSKEILDSGNMKIVIDQPCIKGSPRF